MYELEILHKDTNEDSTWLTHESTVLTQELLEFIENESKETNGLLHVRVK